MATRLPGDDNPVEVDGVRITAPGLEATCEVHRGEAGTTRAASLQQPELDGVLARAGMFQDLLIELTDQDEAPSGVTVAGQRSTARGEPAIEIEVPAPSPGWGQVMLAVAEDGTLAWYPPDDVDAEHPAPTTRGSERVRFTVPRTVVDEGAEAPGTRGAITAVGRKLFKVVAFKLAGKAIGLAADLAVGWWEQRNRPHRLRSFLPDTHGTGDVEDLTSEQLRAIIGGGERTLLFVHGTSSTTQGAFHALPDDFVQHLHQVYGGRVFAFDHPTISVPPQDNVRWLAGHLADHVAPDVTLDLDVVTHSRGGLVSRVMAARPELGGLAPERLRVHRVVFGATPNAGTPLCDPTHIREYVDTWTNIVQFVPDNPVTGTLEVVLEVVKYMASGAVGGLDGLQSMDPDAAFLSHRLNVPGGRTDTSYHALAADYEPPAGSGLGRFVRDRLTDDVFAGADNDLVVPTAGVADDNGADGFPVTDLVSFDEDDGVHHSGLWSRRRTVEALQGWLTG